MKFMINLCGPMVALLTPFKIDNTVDFKAFDQLIDFHAWSGTTAVVVASAIGEAQTLSIEEHSALYRAAVQRADGRIATIAGIEYQSTRTACQLACEAAIAGVDAALCIAPHFNGTNRNSVVRHFSSVAEASGLPVIIKDSPLLPCREMSDELVIEFSEDPRMVGFTDATGDLERTLRLIELVASGFRIYSALDSIAYDVVAAGGAGVLSVAANIEPVTMRMMCQAAAYGDAREAAALDASLTPLYDFLSAEPNPISAKFLAGEMGLMRPNVRPPLAACSEVARRFAENSGVHRWTRSISCEEVG